MHIGLISVKGNTFDLSLRPFSSTTHFITHGIVNITHEILIQIVPFLNFKDLKIAHVLGFLPH